ncbi:unnamed protein product, partial [Ectocarpus fasciculatus]
MPHGIESLVPATISPEGSRPDSEHLSNWGSVEDDPAVATTTTTSATSRQQQQQQRRQPAASSNTSRRTSNPSSSTVRSDARRGYAGSNARLAGSKAGAGAAGRLSLMANGRSQTSAATKQTTAAPSSGRGTRTGPVDRPTASSSQERPSVGAGTRPAARKRLSVGRNGASKPRSSSVGKRSSLGSSRRAEEDREEEEEEDALRGIGDLDAVAPSQEEIRLMIDRIRRESAVEEVVGAGGRTVSSSKNGPRFEHEAAPASGNSITSKLLRSARGVGRQQQQPASPPTPAIGNGSLVSSTVVAPASHHRRGSASNSEVAVTATAAAGGGGGGTEAGAGVGVVGMGEIEEEERRLQEKASKLELEMSAVQSRRLEVYLVKVEQQLQEEAAMRLVQREARINLEVERSCKALAAERDERVSGVAAAKVRTAVQVVATVQERIVT